MPKGTRDMPHKTNLEPQGVYWQFYGIVAFGEIIAANGEVWGHPGWNKLRYQIVDFLNIEKLDLRDDQAAVAAYMDKAASKTSPQMKVAFVADDTDCLELCKAYIAELDEPGWEARIFDELAAASEWAKS